MIRLRLMFTTLLLFVMHYSKAEPLPIDTLVSNDISKPLVLYISGDGGFNNFSNKFIHKWNKLGYPVVALNAKSYFWKTKIPEDAARDVTELITQYLALWKRREVILLGYSFGSDVMPFIQTRLSPQIQDKVRHIILYSPSKNTDFTIHLFYDDKGSSVSAEINKLSKPVLVIFGDEEQDPPETQINNKMVTLIKVQGNHHYDENIAGAVQAAVKRL